MKAAAHVWHTSVGPAGRRIAAVCWSRLAAHWVQGRHPRLARLLGAVCARDRGTQHSAMPLLGRQPGAAVHACQAATWDTAHATVKLQPGQLCATVKLPATTPASSSSDSKSASGASLPIRRRLRRLALAAWQAGKVGWGGLVGAATSREGKLRCIGAAVTQQGDGTTCAISPQTASCFKHVATNCAHSRPPTWPMGKALLAAAAAASAPGMASHRGLNTRSNCGGRAGMQAGA